MCRDKLESLTDLKKLCVVEFIFQGIDVTDQHSFVILGPFVVDFDLLVFVQNQRLIQKRYFGHRMWILNTFPYSCLIFAIADGLD